MIWLLILKCAISLFGNHISKMSVYIFPDIHHQTVVAKFHKNSTMPGEIEKFYSSGVNWLPNPENVPYLHFAIRYQKCLSIFFEISISKLLLQNSMKIQLFQGEFYKFTSFG